MRGDVESQFVDQGAGSRAGGLLGDDIAEVARAPVSGRPVMGRATLQFMRTIGTQRACRWPLDAAAE